MPALWLSFDWAKAEPTENWTLKIERKKNSPEDRTIKMFYLDEIYKEHDKLELKDLMDFEELQY